MNGTMGLRSPMQTSIEAEGKMGLYFRTAPMLVTMKSIPLLDAELDMGAEADANEQADQMDRYVQMLMSSVLFLSLELVMKVLNIRIRNHFFVQ